MYPGEYPYYLSCHPLYPRGLSLVKHSPETTNVMIIPSHLMIAEKQMITKQKQNIPWQLFSQTSFHKTFWRNYQWIRTMKGKMELVHVQEWESCVSQIQIWLLPADWECAYLMVSELTLERKVWVWDLAKVIVLGHFSVTVPQVYNGVPANLIPEVTLWCFTVCSISSRGGVGIHMDLVTSC